MGAEGGSGRGETTGQVVSLKLEQNSGGQVAQRPTKYDAGKAASQRRNGEKERRYLTRYFRMKRERGKGLS